MTDLLDEAIAKIRRLSAERQEDAALTLLALAAEGDVYYLSLEEHADLEEADREIERGEIASDEEITKFRRKFGL